MRDRIPTYPGRIKLTPVKNQANTYDLERADEPLQEGTPLNKSALLNDETAQKFGLSEEATINDVLSIIGSKLPIISAPILTISGDVLTVTSIDEPATKVRLYRNGEMFTDIVNDSSGTLAYPLSNMGWADGIYEISAKAMATGYLDSPFSNSIVYVVGEIGTSLASAEGVSF